MSKKFEKIWYVVFTILMIVFLLINVWFLIYEPFRLSILLYGIWDFLWVLYGIYNLKKVFKKSKDSLAD